MSTQNTSQPTDAYNGLLAMKVESRNHFIVIAQNCVDQKSGKQFERDPEEALEYCAERNNFPFSNEEIIDALKRLEKIK